jgi:thiol-disulfide isomerase/thioredoxin
MSEEQNENEWIICPECKTKLKKEHIATHMKHIHNKKIEDFDESSIKVLPKKEQKQKKPMHLSLNTIAIISVIFVVIIAAAVFVLSWSPDGSNNNGNSNKLQWLDDYTPAYSVGTVSENFWINFPVGSPSAGQSLNHLTWITEDLKEKPVVFVCHRTGCGPCTPQADRVKALREIYGEDAIFYDLDYPFEGYGVATEDILQKFNEAFYYDPNGEPHYIAFTGIFTLINDGGVVKIGWHSWEGDVADAEMETWIKDSIYYYNVNSEK